MTIHWPLSELAHYDVDFSRVRLAIRLQENGWWYASVEDRKTRVTKVCTSHEDPVRAVTYVLRQAFSIAMPGVRINRNERELHAR